MNITFRKTFISFALSAFLTLPAWANTDTKTPTEAEKYAFQHASLDDYMVSYYTLKSPLSSVMLDLEQEDCIRFYLDTTSDHGFELWDHHQSAVMLPSYDNGDQFIWVAHSDQDQGELLRFEASSSHRNTQTDLMKSDVVVPLEATDKIEETHPSGMTYYPFQENLNMQGILFFASENKNALVAKEYDDFELLGEHKIEFDEHDFNGEKITDVWVARDGETTYLLAWSMNSGVGKAYHAPTRYLSRLPNFEKMTDSNNSYINDYIRSGIGDGPYNPLLLFEEIGKFESPIKNPPCGKQLGQNAQLVLDSENKWYVLHAYSNGGYVCGINSGPTEINAYGITLSKTGITISSHRESSINLLSNSGTYNPGGDGAAGFFVNKHGILNVLLGAQYANWSLIDFDYKTEMAQCVATPQK